MSAAVSAAPLFEVIAEEATSESPLWASALRAPEVREADAVFSPLVRDPALRLGVETIYEGYLLHYGRPRIFDPPDPDTALLLGDYLYAHGLVHISRAGNVRAVHDLAELISLCAQLAADGTGGDAEVWAATAALLGEGALDGCRAALRDRGDALPLLAAARAAAGGEAVERACATHHLRVR
jgi:hypothetical protein